MAKKKRRSFSSALKAKIGLEALMGLKAIGQIARENKLHANQVTQWKRELGERLPQVFEKPGGEADERDEIIEQLLSHTWVRAHSICSTVISQDSRHFSRKALSGLRRSASVGFPVISASAGVVRTAIQPQVRHQPPGDVRTRIPLRSLCGRRWDS